MVGVRQASCCVGLGGCPLAKAPAGFRWVPRDVPRYPAAFSPSRAIASVVAALRSILLVPASGKASTIHTRRGCMYAGARASAQRVALERVHVHLAVLGDTRRAGIPPDTRRPRG